MPQTETAEIHRVLRALVPLSALPLLWKELNDEAIAEHLATILIKILGADFVYISASTHQHVLEVACGPKGRSPPALTAKLIQSLSGLSAGRPFSIESPLSGDRVTVLSLPLHFADGAALTVASTRADYPTAIDRHILRMAANQATATLERAAAFAVAQHLTALVNLSSSFIGVANLQGMPLFVNPAGLKLVGLSSIEEALVLPALDFLEPCDRDRARYEVWPEVMAEGRWSGQLTFFNARTRVATPLMVESFRIDTPMAVPVAVGTINIDLRKWMRTESAPVVSLALGETHQVMQAIARVETLSEREHQVLSALAAGHSHKVIGHDLGISVRTVEVHRSRMMRRLGVRSLAEAIKIAVISGAVT